jgi:serine/threonine protein kinase
MIGKRTRSRPPSPVIPGVVYRATDARLRRTVAVKILPEDAGSALRRERFLREAQAAYALNHGIVTIHDVGHDQGVDFIVMELVVCQNSTGAKHSGVG